MLDGYRLIDGGKAMADEYLTRNIIPAINSKIVGGKGAIFYLDDGRKVLDFSAQTLNLSLGHNYPELIEAAKTQLDRLAYHSSRFMSDVFINLSEKLVSLTDKHLNKINLKLTDGSDAVESAIKRARVASGKPYIVAFKGSHHGETVETLASSGKHFDGPFLGSSRKYLWLEPDDSCEDELAGWLRSRKDIAGVIVEPVMVNAGVIVHPTGRLRRIRELCSKFGVALIFDEIQTAFGWVGTTFAYERLGVVPDMLALGKALAPGFPLAALALNNQYDVLDYGYDELTYGGHPVSCAVALENLKILAETDFKISKKEGLLARGLNKYGGRGMGLIWGVPGQDIKRAKRIYTDCFDQGLLLRLSGDESTLILKPPLMVTEVQIRQALGIFEKIWLGQS